MEKDCVLDDVLVRRRTIPAADEDIVTVREVGSEETKVDEAVVGSVIRQPRGRIVD